MHTGRWREIVGAVLVGTAGSAMASNTVWSVGVQTPGVQVRVGPPPTVVVVQQPVEVAPSGRHPSQGRQWITHGRTTLRDRWNQQNEVLPQRPRETHVVHHHIIYSSQPVTIMQPVPVQRWPAR